MKALIQDSNKAFAFFQGQWDELGTKRRHATEQAALDQINNDPLYAQGKLAHKSYVFNLALDALDGII